jgi:hypothetical protein
MWGVSFEKKSANFIKAMLQFLKIFLYSNEIVVRFYVFHMWLSFGFWMHIDELFKLMACVCHFNYITNLHSYFWDLGQIASCKVGS